MEWHGWNKIGAGSGLEKYWKINDMINVFHEMKKNKALLRFGMFCYVRKNIGKLKIWSMYFIKWKKNYLDLKCSVMFFCYVMFLCSFFFSVRYFIIFDY